VGRTSGSAEVTIPLRAQSSISLHLPSGGVTVTPLGVSPQAGVGRLAQGGGYVSYASTARATSTRVLARPDGAEIMQVLASPAAPSSFSWRVMIDGVEELVPAKGGEVEVVETAGPTIVSPAAKPQQGAGQRDAQANTAPAAPVQAGSASASSMQASSAPALAQPAQEGAQSAASPRELPPAPNSLPLDAGDTPEAPIGAPCDLASTVPPADRPEQSTIEQSATSSTGMPGALQDSSPELLDETPALACTPTYEFTGESSSAGPSPSVASAAARATGPAAPPASPPPASSSAPPPGPHRSDQIPHEVLLATILPPRSYDARGQQVPTSLTVNGDVVTMSLDTHAGRYVYPIIADPVIGEGEKSSYEPPKWSIVQTGTDQFGRHVLTLEGKEWWAVGFNDYRLMNYAYKLGHPFVNNTGQSEGCGSILNSEDQKYQLERIKDSGATAIRVWFFQKYYQDYESDPSYGSSNGGHPDAWLPTSICLNWLRKNISW
jgi:hypothetical protein